MASQKTTAKRLNRVTSSSTKRPAEPSAEQQFAKDKLVLIAGELFSQHGFDGVSTREIAGKAKLNVSLISYYFGGKEGLYKAVIHEFAMRMHRESRVFMQEFNDGKLDASTFVATLTKALVATARLKIEMRHLSLLLHREMMNGFPYAREVHDTVFNELAKEAIDIFRRAQKRGILRKSIVPETLFLTMIFALDNFVLQSQAGTSFWKTCPSACDSVEDFVPQMVAILFEGAMK